MPTEPPRAARRIAGVAAYVLFLPVIAEGTSRLLLASDWAREHCDERHVDCLFLRPSFVRARAAGERLTTRGHWNPAEHLIGARAVAAYLARHHLADTATGSRTPGGAR